MTAETDDEQLDRQGTFEPIEHVGPETQTFLMGQLVGTVFGKAFFRLFGAQSVQRGIERIKRILDWRGAEVRQSLFMLVQSVPGGWFRRGTVLRLL